MQAKPQPATAAIAGVAIVSCDLDGCEAMIVADDPTRGAWVHLTNLTGDQRTYDFCLMAHAQAWLHRPRGA